MIPTRVLGLSYSLVTWLIQIRRLYGIGIVVDKWYILLIIKLEFWGIFHNIKILNNLLF